MVWLACCSLCIEQQRWEWSWELIWHEQERGGGLEPAWRSWDYLQQIKREPTSERFRGNSTGTLVHTWAPPFASPLLASPVASVMFSSPWYVDKTVVWIGLTLTYTGISSLGVLREALELDRSGTGIDPRTRQGSIRVTVPSVHIIHQAASR